jgi:hypothetical protein
MPSADHEQRSSSSERTVRTNRSAKALAFGVRTGVFITRAPSERKTSSKEAVNFESRSRIRNRTLSASPSMARFLARWVIQPASGLALTPAMRIRLVPTSMKKQHVEGPQEHRLHGE